MDKAEQLGLPVLDEDGFRELLANGPAGASGSAPSDASDGAATGAATGAANDGDGAEDHQEELPE
jgi:DNA ligase (NAD+)